MVRSTFAFAVGQVRLVRRRARGCIGVAAPATFTRQSAACHRTTRAQS